jgi:hypothetical protein
MTRSSPPDPAVYGPNLAIAGHSLSGQPPDAGAASDDARTGADRPPARERRSDTPEDRTAAYRTRPGRGIGPSEIEAVMAESGIDLAAYAGGVTTLSFEPVLLLKSSRPHPPAIARTAMTRPISGRVRSYRRISTSTWRSTPRSASSGCRSRPTSTTAPTRTRSRTARSMQIWRASPAAGASRRRPAI